jgi:hypothetical protein
MMSDGRVARGASAVLWWLALAVVALIACAAVVSLASRLAALWRDFPGGIGVLGLVAAVVLGGGAVAIGLVLVRSERLRGWMPWSGLLLVLATRLVIVVLLPTKLTPDTDPAILNDLALDVLGGANPVAAHRPMGYPTMIAALYAAFGTDPQLAELLNVAFALLTAAALWLLLARGWGRETAAVGLVVYALVPSAVFFTPLLFTDTAYGGALVAAVAALAAIVPRGPEKAEPETRMLAGVALVSGALLGLSQYVRPMSQALLAAWVIVPFLTGLAVRRAALAACIAIVGFVLVLAPIVAYNLEKHGDLSLSTSAYGGWSLYVGANQEYDGQFNREDRSILVAPAGTSIWDRSDVAGELAVRRILDDPQGFASLGVRKFWIQWSDDTYGATYALSVPGVDERTRQVFALLSQVAYATLTVAAAVALYRGRRQRHLVALFVATLVVIVAAAHVLIEVQPRYHAYVIPLLVVLAAPWASGVLRRAAR